MTHFFTPARALRWVLAISLAITGVTVHAATQVNVAVVTDGPQLQLKEVEDVFREELLALTANEFDVQFQNRVADWSSASVERALSSAYEDSSIDMVLVLGIAANQLAVSRDRFPKPTFMPLVFNPDILDAPVDNDRSGRRNLNYLADRVPFGEDLASFQRVTPFQNAVLLTDRAIIEAIPRSREYLREQGAGVTFTFVGHDGENHDLLSRIPADTEAILLGGLPRLPRADLDALLAGLAQRQLPSFSLVSESEVVRGALAADTVQTDYRRMARRNALNMQAVMLGERAEDQPVYYDGKRQLTINMDTARAIGLSPRFDVLSEAELLNMQVTATGPELNLVRVAQLAMAENLDLAVSEFDVAVGEQSVASARSTLLPQLSVGGNYTLRRDQVLTRTPGFAERSTAGVVSLDQLVYSEAARSGYQQEKFLQQGRVAALDAVRLDQVLNATTAYLQALRAENQLKIQQENLGLTKSNLELARDRVRAGSASNADVYRWEARLAEARSTVFAARAALRQAEDALNRLLNQAAGTPLRLGTPSKNDPFTMTVEDFDRLVNSPRRFDWFMDFSVVVGLEQAPELAQLQAQLEAVARDRVARRRAYFVPDVSVQAQYSDSIDASGLGSGSDFDTVNDWSVSLNASWPLFDSGQRRSQLSRATLQERQLTTQIAATRQRIEQSVRSAMHVAQSSYVNIDLSQSGAEASRKNLALVSDAYRQGSVTIIELLDAQNQSLSADLNANNAIHDFLINIMNYQRAVGSFDFLLPVEAQAERTQSLLRYIETQEAQRTTPGVKP
ncbi:MAG: TolC family protein [Gammaproteobacteria bacterium]